MTNNVRAIEFTIDQEFRFLNANPRYLLEYTTQERFDENTRANLAAALMLNGFTADNHPGLIAAICLGIRSKVLKAFGKRIRRMMKEDEKRAESNPFIQQVTFANN